MPAYLVYNDYAVTIQDSAFKQWIAQNDALRVQAEPRAMAKIKEFLVQKYDLVTEFAPTTVYADTPTYQANALVQLNYAAWVATTAYTAGQYVSYTDGNVYRCILTVVGNAAPGNATYWLLIGPQLGLFYLAYPAPVFNLGTVYNVGDKVWWKGSVYVCQTATVLPSHYSDLQSVTYANICPYNFFPTDPKNGPTQWGVGTPYSVTGIYPAFVPTEGTWSGVTAYSIGDTVNYNGVMWQALKANTNVIPGADIVTWQSITWTQGDNRNQSIVDVMVSLTLWYLSFRIAPKVIPTWIQTRYDSAMAWLQNSAEGIITLDVPEVQPAQGARIRFGGNVKQQNGY